MDSIAVIFLVILSVLIKKNYMLFMATNGLLLLSSLLWKQYTVNIFYVALCAVKKLLTHSLTQCTTNKNAYLPVDKLVKNDDLTGVNVLSKWPNSRRYDDTAASFFLQSPYVSTIVHVGRTDGVFLTMPDSNNPPLSIFVFLHVTPGQSWGLRPWSYVKTGLRLASVLVLQL